LAVSARWSSSFFLCCHGVLFGRQRLDQDVLGRVRNVLGEEPAILFLLEFLIWNEIVHYFFNLDKEYL
jgi:hypothetical protein